MPIFPVTQLSMQPIPLPFGCERKDLIDKNSYEAGSPVFIRPFGLMTKFDKIDSENITIDQVKTIAPSNGTIGKLNIIMSRVKVKNAVKPKIDINLVVQTGVATPVVTTLVQLDFETLDVIVQYIGIGTANFLKDDAIWFEVNVGTDALLTSGNGEVDMSALNYIYTVLP